MNGNGLALISAGGGGGPQDTCRGPRDRSPLVSGVDVIMATGSGPTAVVVAVGVPGPSARSDSGGCVRVSLGGVFLAFGG